MYVNSTVWSLIQPSISAHSHSWCFVFLWFYFFSVSCSSFLELHLREFGYLNWSYGPPERRCRCLYQSPEDTSLGYSDFNSWLHVFPALLGNINMELRGSFPLLPCSVSDDKFPCCWGLSRWGPFGVPASGSVQESCPPPVQCSFQSTDPNLRSPGFGGDSCGGILPQHMFFPQGLCSHFLCDLSSPFFLCWLSNLF